MGAFAETAQHYAALGLVPTPTGGTDGKRPLLKAYNRIVLRGSALADVARKNPNANVALLTGASGLNVVDIDDPSLLRQMERRFGQTPLMTKTAGRGGYQMFYRESPHVGPVDLRISEGIEVEVKARGNIVIAPPSRNPITGRTYECIEGAFDRATLSALPLFPVRAVFPFAKSASEHRRITEGLRSDWLFSQCLREARNVDDRETLLDVALTRNDECEPALSVSEVERIVRSAWSYQERGSNFVGAGGHVVLNRRRIEQLCAADPGNPVSLALRMELEHAARVARGETFAISRRDMAAANSIPGWTEKHIRTGTEKAVAMGLIVPASEPRRGAARQYTLPDRSGPALGPNVTIHPSPSPLPCTNARGRK